MLTMRAELMRRFAAACQKAFPAVAGAVPCVVKPCGVAAADGSAPEYQFNSSMGLFAALKRAKCVSPAVHLWPWC